MEVLGPLQDPPFPVCSRCPVVHRPPTPRQSHRPQGHRGRGGGLRCKSGDLLALLQCRLMSPFAACLPPLFFWSQVLGNEGGWKVEGTASPGTVSRTALVVGCVEQQPILWYRLVVALVESPYMCTKTPRLVKTNTQKRASTSTKKTCKQRGHQHGCRILFRPPRPCVAAIRVLVPLKDDDHSCGTLWPQISWPILQTSVMRPHAGHLLVDQQRAEG